VNNGTQIYNGPPPPEVKWEQQKSVEPWKGLGRTTVTLSVDRIPGTLGFIAKCDGPCTGAGAFRVVDGELSLSESLSYSSPLDPSYAIVVMRPHQPIVAGEELKWVFKTDTPILYVQVLSEDSISKLPQPPPNSGTVIETTGEWDIPPGITVTK
jgi:hypothetical protein